MTYKHSKPGQIDLVFGLWSEFISAAVMICATLVNTQTHKATGRQHSTVYTISSAS